MDQARQLDQFLDRLAAGVEVSILVVMDQARQLLAADQLGRVLADVSILVVMDQARQHRPRIIVGGLTDRFQSLLSWIKLANPIGSASSALVIGFNPCCHGSSSPTPGKPFPRRCREWVSILVVMDQARQPVRERPRESGHVMFQSLLSWIKLANGRSAGRGGSADGFQSLLSWIKLANRPAARRWWHAMGFNPCCHGSSSPTPSIRPTPAPASGVSILVVMDQARQRHSSAAVSRAESGFNPCCHGSSSPTARRAQSHVPRRVSILVVMDQARQPCG